MTTLGDLRLAAAGAGLNGSGPPHNRLSLAGQLVAHLAGGGSLLLTGSEGSGAVLDAAADALGKTRARVLKVRPPLDLRGFMEQVGRTGRAIGDDDVERGFNALTALDPGCDRIVLLVEDAHLLPHTTLFYLQFVLRAGPPLQLAFAGRPEIADALALEGFAGLRGRFSLHLTMAAPSPELAEPTVQAGNNSRTRRVLARLAAYAGLWSKPLHPHPLASASKAVSSSRTVEHRNDIKGRTAPRPNV